MRAWLPLLALLSAPAAAGDLVVQSQVPVELSVGTTPLVKTFGPTRLRLPELAPGVLDLRVQRGQQVEVVPVALPAKGEVVVELGEARSRLLPTAEAAPGPVLELRAARGQRFAYVLDGARLAVVGSHQAVRVEGIGAGPHKLELRSADLTVVWARVDLDLRADDQLVLTGREGYAPQIEGRADAVSLVGGERGGGVGSP